MQNIKNKLLRRKTGILDDQGLLAHAVLIPLISADGGPSVLFEVRSHSLKEQPGEICFPGGHCEDGDGSPRDTALRETCEELRINRSDLDVWGPLDVLITPHQLVIHPYVGLILEKEKIKPDPTEVEEVFVVPLQFFLETKPVIRLVDVVMQPGADFPYHLIPNGRDYNWRRGQYPVYFYHYENYLIWGLTARILYHFIEVIR